MIFRNPIIHKEVLSSLRTRKAVAMQALFLLVTAALIWLQWPTGGFQEIGGTQARRILSMVAIVEMVMVAMFAPAFTAASLTLEKERRTLESLLATTLRPGEIAFGKMVGSLTFLLLLVLSGAPALAAPFLLGGVGGAEVLRVVGILLLTAVYLGMIGLLVSSFMHRSYRAIIVTYAVLLCVLLLMALPAWPVSGDILRRGGTAWQAAWHLLASFSPVQALLSVIWPGSAYARGATFMPPFWACFIPLALAVTGVTAVLCVRNLRRPLVPPRPRERLKVVERGGKFTARKVLFLIDPRKRKRMIADWQNPILLKEFRTRPMLQTHWLIRAVALCFIVSILLMFLMGVGVAAFVGEGMDKIQDMATAVSALMVLAVVLMGPATAGGAICSDRESGVWELIRATRLSSLQIALGKFAASVIPLLLLVLAMLPALAILLYFNPSLLLNMVQVLAVLAVTVLFVSTLGLFFSSLFPRTSTATAWTYGVVTVLSLLTLLAMFGQEQFSRRFLAAVFLVNPVAAAMGAAGNASMQKFGLLAPHLEILGGATAALFAATIFRVHQLRRPE